MSIRKTLLNLGIKEGEPNRHKVTLAPGEGGGARIWAMPREDDPDQSFHALYVDEACPDGTSKLDRIKAVVSEWKARYDGPARLPPNVSGLA